MQFTHLQLHERLHRALATAGYTTPTPIQAAALPVALTGSDIVGTAQTGTGKTIAFVLPILQRLLNTPAAGRKTRALVLTPTRELAEQVNDAFQQMSCHTNLRSATVYGGVGMAQQERALRNGTEIIVACPGRLLDHVARGGTDFSQVECLVLDEADRMLDMGFLPPITRIIGLLPRERQTMLYSATFAPELNKFVNANLRRPERIDIGLTAPAETVSHTLYPVPQHLKTGLLAEVLKQTETQSVLVFTRTKHRANRVAEQIAKAGYATGVLHSNKSQNQRQLALDQFRCGKLHVLVATDIAARGIDVTTISHVINYDIPDCADTYIHRIGRTGRAERSGEALTFVTLDDAPAIRDIERTLGARIPTRMVETFNYSQPAPRSDEFKRAPQPPRRPTTPAQPKGSVKNAAVRATSPAPTRQSNPYGSRTARPGSQPHSRRKDARPAATSRGRRNMG